MFQSKNIPVKFIVIVNKMNVTENTEGLQAVTQIFGTKIKLPM